MAIACFGLVTFLPLRPDLSFPFFISFISVSTFFPEDGEYLRVEDFFEADFFVLLDLFFAAFLVAIDSLLENQMAWCLEQVVCRFCQYRCAVISAANKNSRPNKYLMRVSTSRWP